MIFNRMSFVIVVGALVTRAGLAAEGKSAQEVQPYLESLKQKNAITAKPSWPPPPVESKPDVPTPATAVSNDPKVVQPYLESLKVRDGQETADQSPKAPDSNKASPQAREAQPYIEALKSGKDLEPKMKKTVDQAAGLTVVTSDNIKVSSTSAQANSFESVYHPNDKYNIGFDLFYEKQFLRSRALGSLALSGHLGFVTIKGKGVFTKSGQTSDDTAFRFSALPISVGLSYRLVQTRILIPFVEAGVMGVPFLESRSDEKPNRRAISRGYRASFGVALNLDWLGSRNAWTQYDNHGIVHTYIVAQREFIRTLSSSIRFDYDGTFAGLMFEF